jgi:hypothetical protein
MLTSSSPPAVGILRPYRCTKRGAVLLVLRWEVFLAVLKLLMVLLSSLELVKAA